jgi:hypothetical protein
MTSSGCSVNDFSRSYNSTALLTARSGTFVLIAFPMRARSWYFSFLSFVIASDVALGGAVAGDVIAGGVVAEGVVAEGVVAEGVVAEGVVAEGVVAEGVVARGVVARGVIAGEDGSNDMALMDINRLEGALMEVHTGP